MGPKADTKKANAPEEEKKKEVVCRVGVAREGISGAPVVKEEVSGCLGGICGSVEEIEELEGGKQRKVVVRTGGAITDTVIAVTKFKVTCGKIVVVAPVGSFVGNTEVAAKTVLGVETTGRLLDEASLGWKDGASGEALYLHPKQFVPGDTAPSARPERVREREVDAMGNAILANAIELLSISKPKATKEEKAAIKKAKDKAKRAAKGEEEPEEEEAELPELVEPSKKDIKAAKKRALDKRKAAEAPDADGAAATTDDELEAAGFAPQC